MKKWLAVAFLFFSFSAFAAEPVGLVIDSIGDVTVTSEGGKPIAPKLQQTVYLGDTIQTKSSGGMKILFKDDTVLTVKENSKTLISKFLFDPAKKERKAVFNVLFGKIRTVVGRFFGQDQPVEITTPTAVGGIRGTDIAAVVKKEETTFYCFDGLFGVYSKDYPDKVLEVSKGLFTEVFEGKTPTPLRPIPKEILDENNMLFDIPISANSQLSQSVTHSVAQNAVLAMALPTATATATQQAASTVQSVAASVFAAASQADSMTTSIVNNAPTAATDLGVQILPGAATQSTNSISINIILP